MAPEQKVVSLSTAKRLKEAGFPQDTERVWLQNVLMRRLDEYGEERLEVIDHKTDVTKGWVDELFAAPDAQEIDLPLTYGKFELDIFRDEDLWVVCYVHPENPDRKTSEMPWFHNINMAEAFAETRLWFEERKQK